jgi:hypothetical protein
MHLSSVSRLPDLPEHYSVIAFDLADVDGGTSLHVSDTLIRIGAGRWTFSRHSSNLHRPQSDVIPPIHIYFLIAPYC